MPGTNYRKPNPVIGVFIKDFNQNLLSLHRGNIDGLCRALNARAFLFSPGQIDYKASLIKGVVFDGGRLKTEVFPFPDFLYLQGGLEMLNPAELHSFCIIVKNSKSRIITNPLEFDKWDIYRVLSQSPGLKTHLPQTRLFQEIHDLWQMIYRYNELYLKACRGRRGEQVMRLACLPDRSFRCDHFMGKPVTRYAAHSTNLEKLIKSFFQGKDFIVQQPISLIEHKGQKVDLRAEVQKNGEGALEVVGIPVRVAAEKSPITTHASSFRFEKFFMEMAGYSAAEFRELKSRLYSLLFRIYRNMEDHYGQLSELGIDIGLDKNGKLWIIECNALSARVSLANAYTENTMRRALSNSLEYALFRAGRKTVPDIRRGQFNGHIEKRGLFQRDLRRCKMEAYDMVFTFETTQE